MPFKKAHVQYHSRRACVESRCDESGRKPDFSAFAPWGWYRSISATRVYLSRAVWVGCCGGRGYYYVIGMARSIFRSKELHASAKSEFVDHQLQFCISFED